MALLFMDSFDHSGTSGAVHATKYSTYSGGGSALQPVTTYQRTGTHSLLIAGTDYLERAFTASQLPAASGSTAVVGIAIYTPLITSQNGKEFIEIKEGSTTHVTLATDRSTASSGMYKLAVYKGTTSGTLLGTTTYELNAATWYYIEFKVVIHDTTGTYEVRVDGVNKLSGTNADTRNGATGVFDTIRISSPMDNALLQHYLDDLYVLDGSGATSNTFLGAQSVEWRTGEGANGANTDWTCSTGSNHGALVDEASPDEDSTYNSSSTVGQIDTYPLPDTALPGTIRGVQSVMRVRKTDASARTLKAVFRSGGTNYAQTEREILTTYHYILEPRDTDPNTSAAWATAAVNALEVGPKVET